MRLLDDNEQNLKEFLTIKKDLSPAVLALTRENHFLEKNVDPIEFFAYHIDKDGKMELFGNV